MFYILHNSFWGVKTIMLSSNTLREKMKTNIIEKMKIFEQKLNEGDKIK